MDLCKYMYVWICVRICTCGLVYVYVRMNLRTRSVYICKEISKETPFSSHFVTSPKKLKRQINPTVLKMNIPAQVGTG